MRSSCGARRSSPARCCDLRENKRERERTERAICPLRPFLFRKAALRSRVLHGNADLRDELLRVTGKALIDHGDLPGKAADPQPAAADEIVQRPVLRGRLEVMAPEADAGAACLRQAQDRPVYAVRLVQQEERAVVAVVLRPGQPLRGDAEANLAQKDQRLRLRRGQLPGGQLQLVIISGRQLPSCFSARL